MTYNKENWDWILKSGRMRILNKVARFSDVEGLCGCNGVLCDRCGFRRFAGQPNAIDLNFICTHPRHPLNSMSHDELVTAAVLEEL